MPDSLTILDPVTQRDFSRGRIAKTAVSPALVPPNSVSNSINVDYSEIIGSGIVRRGKNQIVQIGAHVIDGQSYRPSTTNATSIYGSQYIAQTYTLAVSSPQIISYVFKLSRVGASQGNVTLRIEGVTGGGAPNGVDILKPVVFDASQIPVLTTYGIFNFYVAAGSTLVAGQYALVLEYPSGDGSSFYIDVIYDSINPISGGTVQQTTNAGGSWSLQGGALYFAEEIIDNGTPYLQKPLGNFSYLNANVGRNVVVFTQPSSATGVLYYWDYAGNAFPGWRSSTLNNLNQNNLVRFANLNGSVFEANGSNPMHDSSDNGATWGIANSISTDSVIPSLLIISNNRMLASGYSGFPSRVYFSDVVNPNSSPFLNWNTNPDDGNWIDINPDDGGIVTGFGKASSLTLVFKDTAMYRLNAITKSVDAENIYNVGAVSQECITSCLGIVYFYSGPGGGIYQTDGTFPQQISRIGVQDFVNAIQSPSEVYAWADVFNVYFSIGSVSITFGPEDTRSYTNVVLKFSPRDQSWQVFTYNQHIAQTSMFGPEPNFGATVAGTTLPGLLTTEYDGFISFLNTNNNTDDNTAIPYSLESQELEFGNRSHTKTISDRMVVYTRYGGNSSFQVKSDDGNFGAIDMQLNNRVNVGADINTSAQFFTFRWQGEAKGSRPIFEGYHLPKIQDLGIIQQK